MKIGKKEFDINNKTYIMGILNVTPDSFSDGGKYDHMDAALYHAEEMIKEGADIVDVGGESTRPGHTVITAQEEISRVAPVIEAIKSRFDVPVSIDTYKGAVTEAALKAAVGLRHIYRVAVAVKQIIMTIIIQENLYLLIPL